MSSLHSTTVIFRHGWNVLALLLLAGGASAAVACWFVTSLFLPETLTTQMFAFGFGDATVVFGDLGYRSQRSDSGLLWRFFSPTAGGSFLLIPSWGMGIGLIATAVAFATGIAE